MALNYFRGACFHQPEGQAKVNFWRDPGWRFGLVLEVPIQKDTGWVKNWLRPGDVAGFGQGA